MAFKPALTHSNRTTAQLKIIIEKQQKILQVVQAVLPEKLMDKVEGCVIKETKLLVYAASAVWSSQLRFFSQPMLNAVKTACDDKIEKIQIKVHLPVRDIPENTIKKKIPSQTNIEALRSSQLQAPESDLKRSLLNLSKTLKKLSGA